jgi:hypothetical protein
MSKQVTEAEQKKIDEAAAAKLKAEQEEADKSEKSEQKPKSNLDMLREQQSINERINYQAAQVKGQTFVRGK